MVLISAFVLQTYTHTVNQMLRVRRGEGCSVIFGLVASFKAVKRKVNVGDAWFRVSPLSVSLSLSWSSDSRTVVCLLLIWPHCRKNCLLYHFSLLVGSNLVFLVFYCEGHGSAEKLLWIIFIFLTNFIDNSLCADPMRRNPFFSILKKVSAPITSGECSRGR